MYTERSVFSFTHRTRLSLHNHRYSSFLRHRGADVRFAVAK